MKWNFYDFLTIELFWNSKIYVNVQIFFLDKTCLLVDLPLRGDYVELIHKWYVDNTNVEVSNIGAEFITGSALVIPALTNNDLGDSVEISMNFKCKSSPKDSYIIVTNGNCDRKHSISIRIETVKTFHIVIGSIKLEGNTTPVEIMKRVVSKRKYIILSIYFSFKQSEIEY